MQPNILNKTSTEIFLSLIELLGEQDATKINNNGKDSGIMAVCIEKQNTIVHPTWPDSPATIYSLAHYYEQNGDLMADPLMEFILIDGRQMREATKLKTGYSDAVLDKIQWVKVQPCLFQQDGIFQAYQQSVVFGEDGKIKGYRMKWLKDHITFAHGWLKNIKWQQLSKDKSLPVASQD